MLQWITGFLAERTIDSPRVCAELLLSHVIGCERTRLYMEVDRPASPTEGPSCPATAPPPGLERRRGLARRPLDSAGPPATRGGRPG